MNSNNQSSTREAFLKFAKRLLLGLLIIIGCFAILNGTNMITMQSKQISAVLEAFDAGNIEEVGPLIRKDMILTHQFFSYAFILSNFCWLAIIIFLYITLRKTRKKQNIPNDQH